MLRNPGTLFGLIVIGAAMIIAITGYLIAPDGSPDANRIIVEIGGRKPGFRQTFLLVRKPGDRPVAGFFHRLLFGQEDVDDYVPIDGDRMERDSLIVQKFVDEGVYERGPIFYRVRRGSKSGDSGWARINRPGYP